MARIEAIWSKTARGGAMEAHDNGELVEASGLRGSANQGGERQLTILSQEAWNVAAASLDVTLDPILRRANVLVSGLDLRESVGRILKLGGCRIRIRGETWPCYQMDQAHQGLLEALVPDWRAGAYGEIESGGRIAVGEAASWEEE